MGSGGDQPGSACGSDGLVAAVVLVVRCDVADAFVQSDGVVVHPELVEFAFAEATDRVQVGELRTGNWCTNSDAESIQVDRLRTPGMIQRTRAPSTFVTRPTNHAA